MRHELDVDAGVLLEPGHEQEVTLVARPDGVVADERDLLTAVLLLQRLRARDRRRFDGRRRGPSLRRLADAPRRADAQRGDERQCARQPRHD